MTRQNLPSDTPITRLRSYTRKITEEYMLVRGGLEHITPELLHIFSEGKAEILQRVAAGLSATSPGHPDLPIIYSVAQEIKQSTAPLRAVHGPGKGRTPVYSIPLDAVPESLLEVIKRSHYKARLKKDLTYALREILGAAQRAGFPQTLDRKSLTAYSAELEARGLSAKSRVRKFQDISRLGGLVALNKETMQVVRNELRSAKLEAAREPSQRNAAFRAEPLSPLDYARIARMVSQEAYATKGNRQTVQRLFITAAVLSLLSFLPERVSDILGLAVGKDVMRDARGWSSEYFSRKTGVDRSFEYLPDQLTPYLDDLILLGAMPGPQGRNFASLYRHRVTERSPLFARTDLRRAYSTNRIWELVKERTGHGPHASRKAMTDYLAEIGSDPKDVLDLLGHRKMSTSEAHYAVRAAAIKRKRTLDEVDQLREKLADAGKFRLPTGKLVDLDRIAKDLDRV